MRRRSDARRAVRTGPDRNIKPNRIDVVSGPALPRAGSTTRRQAVHNRREALSIRGRARAVVASGIFQFPAASECSDIHNAPAAWHRVNVRYHRLSKKEHLFCVFLSVINLAIFFCKNSNKPYKLFSLFQIERRFGHFMIL